MPEPTIKNWRNFPPAGGWSIIYTLTGQSFAFTGSPAKIVEKIRKVQVANEIYDGDGAIWDYVNTIWCQRDPKRCLSKAVAQRSSSTTVRRIGTRSCGTCGGGRVR